jgi:DNA-binding NtrC family response regulator
MTTILIIDSDPALRLLARRVLESAGFTVIDTSNVTAALGLLTARKVDLVVCDIEPFEGGKSAASVVADADPVPHILPMFSKHQNAADISPYIRDGLGKPFTPSELLTKVRRALGARRQISGSD